MMPHQGTQKQGRSPALAASLVLAAILVVPGLGESLAHDGTDHGAQRPEPTQSSQPSEATNNEVDLVEVTLVDWDGKPIEFQSEAVGDRIVAIDFVYTTCSTICPVVSSVFAQVQDELGDRMGRDVWLMSISIDPTRDTPERLRDYADKFGAGPGWIWLTGPKSAVDRVLIGLDAFNADIVDHPSVVLIGDGRSGDWTRHFGFPSPDDIIARLDELVAARKAVQTSLKIED
jgi:protein SCO1/2